jgi:hypothetical protein
MSAFAFSREDEDKDKEEGSAMEGVIGRRKKKKQIAPNRLNLNVFFEFRTEIKTIE